MLDGDVPHLLVSDIGMPGTDGYAMLRRIRALRDARAEIPAWPSPPTCGSEDQARAADAGFQAHLSKPVDPGELQLTIERLARPMAR